MKDGPTNDNHYYWVTLFLAASVSALVVSGAGYLYRGFGFLISIFVVILAVEQIRRSWSPGNAIRLGSTIGLVMGLGSHENYSATRRQLLTRTDP